MSGTIDDVELGVEDGLREDLNDSRWSGNVLGADLVKDRKLTPLGAVRPAWITNIEAEL